MKREVIAARLRRKPIAQIKDDAGEEARFRGAQEKARNVEARCVPDKRHRSGAQAPGDHHPRDPKTRAYLVEDDVRRYFEEKITPEKNASAKTKNSRRKTEVLVHRERGKADIDPVDVGYEVKQHNERNDA